MLIQLGLDFWLDHQGAHAKLLIVSKHVITILVIVEGLHQCPWQFVPVPGPVDQVDHVTCSHRCF